MIDTTHTVVHARPIRNDVCVVTEVSLVVRAVLCACCFVVGLEQIYNV
jgi:hypothetical protein